MYESLTIVLHILPSYCSYPVINSAHMRSEGYCVCVSIIIAETLLASTLKQSFGIGVSRFRAHGFSFCSKVMASFSYHVISLVSMLNEGTYSIDSVQGQ